MGVHAGIRMSKEDCGPKGGGIKTSREGVGGLKGELNGGGESENKQGKG